MMNILFCVSQLIRPVNILWQAKPKYLKNLCYSSYTFSRTFSTTDALPGQKNKDASLGLTTVKVRFPVEPDPEKIVNYVCGTDFFKEDSEPVKIKSDSDYPDWLWTIRLEKAAPLEEMEPTSKAYWRRTKSYFRRYRKELKKIRKF